MDWTQVFANEQNFVHVARTFLLRVPFSFLVCALAGAIACGDHEER